MDLCFCFKLLVHHFCFFLFLFFFFVFSSLCFVKKRLYLYQEAEEGQSNQLQEKMNILQNLMERLRSLVGLKSWDYCVLWKLTEDQRFLEWVDCCCSGVDDNNNNGGGEEEVFHVSSSVVSCRDAMFQHPKTNSCDLLSQLPSSLPLNSGNHADTLFSNQYKWLNFTSSSSDLSSIEETSGTRVLIPIPGGLVELFVANQVAEDQNVIEFITSQCSINILGEEHEAAAAAAMIMNTNNNNMDTNELQSDPHHVHLPYDISIDRIHLCSNNTTSSSPMNFPQQLINFSSSINNNQMARNDFFYEERGSNGLFQDNNHMVDALQNSMITDTSNMHHHVHFMDHQQQQQPLISNDGQAEQQTGNDEKADSVKQETGRSDSDCSDQVDDEDGDTKYRRRNGEGHSKNLMAERKRRKKLQDRLYALRALVPKITKLDRASILGDAIEYVQELQKQAKELQDEVEENSDNESGVQNPAVGGLTHPEGNHYNNNNNVHPQSEFLIHQNGVNHNLGASGNNGSIIDPSSKQNHHESDSINDKAQQMEAQVEVAQLDGNEFFVSIFCEHKAGGFVRLLEALNALGLEVTNANVSSFRCLVSNVFRVKKRDSEMVEADHVRDSLLELTRNPNGSHYWPVDNNNNPWTNSDNHHHHLHSHHIGSYNHLHHLHN